MYRIPAIFLILICILETGHAQQLLDNHSWLKGDPLSKIVSGDLVIPVVDFQGLQPLFQQEDGKVWVVNFWATWCAPCIKELPYFEEVRSKYASRGVEVILVSLDLPAMWESRLPAFIQKKQIASPVVVLDDPDQNTWIPKIDPGWSGAIPATLIYSPTDRKFYETAFDRETLHSAIESFLK